VKEESKINKFKNPAIFLAKPAPTNCPNMAISRKQSSKIWQLRYMHHHIKAHSIMLHDLRQMMVTIAPFLQLWQKLNHFQKNDDLFIYLFSSKFSCPKCQKFFTPIL
jgi:hypothetical protein